MVSFQSLSSPSLVLDYLSMQRNLNRTKRRNPVLAIPPPSIIPQTEESGNLCSKKSSYSDSTLITSNSDASLLTEANSVGIIGGATVDTTLYFVNKLVRWSSKNGERGLPFVLSSDPALSKELLSYQRSSFPSLLGGKGENLQKDPALIIENIRRKRIFLENSGASCIVMPCNVSHSWHDEIVKGCSVPFLHMGECVAKELKEAKLKPLEAGSPLRIGVLGSSAILTAGFYQEKLQHEGFEVVIPDKATTEHTLIPAVEALSRKDIQGAENLFRIALQVLLVRAVSAVILASDDMRGLLLPEDPLLKKCIDPIDALARYTLKHVQPNENGS